MIVVLFRSVWGENVYVVLRSFGGYVVDARGQLEAGCNVAGPYRAPWYIFSWYMRCSVVMAYLIPSCTANDLARFH